jgi:hypothetical protein
MVPTRCIAASIALVSFALNSQALPNDATAGTTPTVLALHDGTPIRLSLTRSLAFANGKPGETTDFEIVDDLRIDGVLVIAHGATATAGITQAEPKTRMTKGGKLGVNLESLPLSNGRAVAIRATQERVQRSGTATSSGPVAPATMVLPTTPSLLFAYGKDEVFPAGSRITVYTDGDLKLDPAGFLVDMAFTSNPPGALVSMYGTPVGRTPFTTRLAPGTYKAVFSADGYYDLIESVLVGPGRAKTVHAAFQLKP